MGTKLKLTTFIHKAITREQRETPAFMPVLSFLTDLYAAQLFPRSFDWDKSPNTTPTPREQYLHEHLDGFESVRARFLRATRVEMHILPPLKGFMMPESEEPSDWICFEVSFYAGARYMMRDDHCCDLQSGKWGRFQKHGLVRDFT